MKTKIQQTTALLSFNKVVVSVFYWCEVNSRHVMNATKRNAVIDG